MKGFQKKTILVCSIVILNVFSVQAKIEIDSTDPNFSNHVLKELGLIREGKRGLVCQVLVERMDADPTTTTIMPLTKDEKTWHPNDRKGTRSHVVPLDTKLRSSARTIPVAASLYLHPSRIDPNLSLFKLGTFIKELANAADLNKGSYSGDYRIQERRATFYRNAWKDSMKGELVGMSDRVETLDYQQSKKLGLLTREHSDLFPILNASLMGQPSSTPLP